ncbi:hypothetical protein [Desulfofalx alkaliphila]|uniref:hypothetical protein n=1 Tax=Desulfofalx alkaliphila TaxID=105483 RepID=UPI0004E16815|nr:hypothetical protein [Desulfofalx alkaliphila]
MKNNYIVNNNGVVNTGQIGGSVINVSSNAIDWTGLTKDLEKFLVECDDKELRKVAAEMLNNVQAKKLNDTKQSAKSFKEKGLDLAKHLGLNILSGFIVHVLAQ